MKLRNLSTLVLLLCGFLAIAQESGISRDWTSFVQTIEVTTDKPIKFRVVGLAKTDGEHDSSWSGIWARVDNTGSEPGFFDNMGDRPIILNEWKSYTVEGEFGKDAEKLSFGGICIGNGTFLFDSFEVFTETPTGSFEKLEIKNSDFENQVKKGMIQDWDLGIRAGQNIRVKEFAYTSCSDAANGKYSLMIKGTGIEEGPSDEIGPKEGFSPQIGTLISMLDNLSIRVERTVGNLKERELDFLLDEKANSIGALIMHLVATEVYYQKRTFEDISYTKEEEEAWEFAMSLGEKGRKNIKNHDAKYYFDIWKNVREKTKAELQKKDDDWLTSNIPGSNTSNHFAWFHVMEHQSSHLGQILLIAKRIPPDPKKITVEEKIKD
ncbi:DinB family protein [Maribacter sp. 2-571]|uniref:DinB family protein n=1 Tax=Maribacter sp. 2-571 TaxID=3417569 RepID=UPI003D3505E4